MTIGRLPLGPRALGGAAAAVEAWLDRTYERHGVRYSTAPLWLACVVVIPVLVATLTPVINLYAPIPAAKLPAVIALIALPLYGTAAIVWLRRGRPVARAVADWWDAGRPESGAPHVWLMLETAPMAAARGLATGGLGSCLVCGIGIGAVLGRRITEILAGETIAIIGALWTAVFYFFITDLLTRPAQSDAASRLPAGFALPGRGVPFGRRMLGSTVTASVLAAFVGVLITDRGASKVSGLIGPMLGAIAVAVVFSLALTIAALRSMLRPLEDLTATASRIGSGDLAARAALTSDDEFGGLAVTFNGMTAELQRSREQLVSAREEERRRLRRDLHDGLGPSLAGIALRLEAVRVRLQSDPGSADAMLVQLRADTVEAIAEIRRLVHGLRPPQLDDLGLIGAIEDWASRLAPEGSADGLQVTVDAPSRLPPLPAAIEVATYRIVEEALTNVVRHAAAHHCVVRIAVADGLTVEIGDDGCGVPDGRRAGVGLNSMRERAAEVGGSCRVESAPGGGTLVLARMPLPNGPA